MKRNLSSREKTLLVVICLLISVIIGYNIFQAQLENILDMEDLIEEKRNHLQYSRELLEKRDEIKREWKKIKSVLSIKKSTDDETAILLVLIEQLADKTNIKKIMTVNPLSVIEKEGLIEIPVQITFTANISSLSRFMYELENSKRPIKIEHLVVNPEIEVPDELNIQMTLVSLYIKNRT